MIEYIQLRNFQAHKETEMEFHPGVNIIVGETNHGKTAIMRALYWLAFGRPAGDSMRRHGVKGDTEVTIETAEHQISRIRGNSTNQYIINDAVLKGFGQSVPQPVIDALNINELNFMRQLDPPFLFSKTAGEVAQYLNRLINLDVIDVSLSNIKRMHSQASQAAESHLREVDRLEHALQKFDWTDAAEAELAKLEKREARLQRLKGAANELDEFLDSVFAFQKTVDMLSYLKDNFRQVQALDAAHKKLEQTKQAYKTLTIACSSAKRAKAALGKLPAVNGAEKAIMALEKRAARCTKTRQACTTLEGALFNTYNEQDKVKHILAEYNASALQLKKAMPETCPLCEQPTRRQR